jgi:hypothetical protein
MEFDLEEQFTVDERVIMLLNKYPIEHLKEIVNGLITQSRKRDETQACNYWNKVATEIKTKTK